MTVQLSDHLRQHLPSGDPFAFLAGLEGETFRHHKHRRTFRAVIGGRSYFIKLHGHTAWGEILKNALRLRWPVLTAKPEWDALQRLKQLGTPSLTAAGWGVRGRFPHRLESFIITEPLEGAIHLDELPAKINSRKPPLNSHRKTQLTRIIIGQLASIARTLHTHGMNHRDFYLCHFMLKDRDWSRRQPDDSITLHVIDLHRMQIRRSGRTPQRWAIKDISGLLFSALDAGITSRDCLRFLSIYWDRNWRDDWDSSRRWRRTVVRRAISLYRSEHGRPPRLPAGLASFS